MTTLIVEGILTELTIFFVKIFKFSLISKLSSSSKLAVQATSSTIRASHGSRTVR